MLGYAWTCMSTFLFVYEMVSVSLLADSLLALSSQKHVLGALTVVFMVLPTVAMAVKTVALLEGRKLANEAQRCFSRSTRTLINNGTSCLTTLGGDARSGIYECRHVIAEGILESGEGSRRCFPHRHEVAVGLLHWHHLDSPFHRSVVSHFCLHSSRRLCGERLLRITRGWLRRSVHAPGVGIRRVRASHGGWIPFGRHWCGCGILCASGHTGNFLAVGSCCVERRGWAIPEFPRSGERRLSFCSAGNSANCASFNLQRVENEDHQDACDCCSVGFLDDVDGVRASETFLPQSMRALQNQLELLCEGRAPCAGVWEGEIGYGWVGWFKLQTCKRRGQRLHARNRLRALSRMTSKPPSIFATESCHTTRLTVIKTRHEFHRPKGLQN